MFELEKTSEVQSLIAITKSDSGVSGPELAKAHMRLGALLAEHIFLPPENTTVVAVLRGGLFFAEGIYLTLGCKFALYDPKGGKFARPCTEHIILADSVINTGKTIVPLLDPKSLVACCVINENSVAQFKTRLHTVRVSKNSFIGSNIKKQTGTVGPDTTMRLFNQL